MEEDREGGAEMLKKEVIGKEEVIEKAMRRNRSGKRKRRRNSREKGRGRWLEC